MNIILRQFQATAEAVAGNGTKAAFQAIDPLLVSQQLLFIEKVHLCTPFAERYRYEYHVSNRKR